MTRNGETGGGRVASEIQNSFPKKNKSGFGVVLSCHNQMDREGFRIFCSSRIKKRRNRRKKRSLNEKKEDVDQKLKSKVTRVLLPKGSRKWEHQNLKWKEEKKEKR